MKPRPVERLRQLWLRRRNPRGERKRGAKGKRRKREETEVIEGIAADFSRKELQEFLEADRYPAPADPLFKELLRERLWKVFGEERTEGSGRERGH
jgi:hypothetical protein